ncbi:MAG: sulfite exporter TauE/SafE family protein [Kordiimonadaceae bacterium]|nr:sulfite exporter TauE/SafE family protein [Kordiimonadaceae bacterium]
MFRNIRSNVEYFIQQCQVAIETERGLFFSLFIGGLLGSISHCTGMCGPFVLAQCGKTDRIGDARSMSLQAALRGALIPYHFGRMTTYIILGVMGANMSEYLVGTAAQTAVASSLLMIAGLLFVAKAFPEVLSFSAGPLLQPANRAYGQLVSTIASPFGASNSTSGLYFFGAMLGFLPCGLVMAAVMAVAATGDPLAAALGMAAFSLGTMPSLIFVGFGANTLRRKWPAQVNRFAKTLMAINGIILCAIALRLAV